MHRDSESKEEVEFRGPSDSVVDVVEGSGYSDDEEKDETSYEARTYELAPDSEEEGEGHEGDTHNVDGEDDRHQQKSRRKSRQSPNRKPVDKSVERNTRTSVDKGAGREYLGESGYATVEEHDKAKIAFEKREQLKKEFQLAPLRCSPIRGYKTDLFQGVVIRSRNGNGLMRPSYSFFFGGDEKPMMVAQKQGNNRTSNYHFFDMSRGVPSGNLSKKSGNYMGKLRSNFKKTEHVLYTNDFERKEAMSLLFDRPGIFNQLSNGSQPRRLNIILPPINHDNNIFEPNALEEMGTSTLIEKFHAGEIENTNLVQTKEPVFENGNYRLNFHGRVTVPSVKNFQLTSADDITQVLCQFGKVSEWMKVKEIKFTTLYLLIIETRCVMCLVRRLGTTSFTLTSNTLSMPFRPLGYVSRSLICK